MKRAEEIYISTDVETDGPIPGPHSMLSLGAAAFRADGRQAGTFTVNLRPLPGAAPETETEKWWQSQPKEVYEAARAGAIEPERAMAKYAAWANSFLLPAVFVGYPAGFDFLFVYWYLRRFEVRSPFSFSALDIKTFAMATMRGAGFADVGYRDSVKKNMPARWFSDRPHTHRAVDDAIEQGELFMRMLHENDGRTGR